MVMISTIHVPFQIKGCNVKVNIKAIHSLFAAFENPIVTLLNLRDCRKTIRTVPPPRPMHARWQDDRSAVFLSRQGKATKSAICLTTGGKIFMPLPILYNWRAAAGSGQKNRRRTEFIPLQCVPFEQEMRSGRRTEFIRVFYPLTHSRLRAAII
jgi:hypothetical protein